MTNLQDNVLLDDLHPARFLKAADLLDRWHVQSITVTISRMTCEETVPKPTDIDPDTKKPRVVMQPVLYFNTKDDKEFPRGILMASRESVQSLKSATGAKTVGEVAGKRITIMVGEFKHKAVLRIDPQPVKDS